jgi:hypothetical protein
MTSSAWPATLLERFSVADPGKVSRFNLEILYVSFLSSFGGIYKLKLSVYYTYFNLFTGGERALGYFYFLWASKNRTNFALYKKSICNKL